MQEEIGLSAYKRPKIYIKCTAAHIVKTLANDELMFSLEFACDSTRDAWL